MTASYPFSLQPEALSFSAWGDWLAQACPLKNNPALPDVDPAVYNPLLGRSRDARVMGDDLKAYITAVSARRLLAELAQAAPEALAEILSSEALGPADANSDRFWMAISWAFTEEHSPQVRTTLAQYRSECARVWRTTTASHNLEALATMAPYWHPTLPEAQTMLASGGGTSRQDEFLIDALATWPQLAAVPACRPWLAELATGLAAEVPRLAHGLAHALQAVARQDALASQLVHSRNRPRPRS